MLFILVINVSYIDVDTSHSIYAYFTVYRQVRHAVL